MTLHDPSPAAEAHRLGRSRCRRRARRSDADWLTVTAWQGGGLPSTGSPSIAPGVYRTTMPIPAYGKWKSMLRLENGRGVPAVPIYLPEDKAIPAKEVPADASFTRPFVRDKEVLQREAVGGTGWLALPAYLLLLAIVSLWLAALGLGPAAPRADGRRALGRGHQRARRAAAASCAGDAGVITLPLATSGTCWSTCCRSSSARSSCSRSGSCSGAARQAPSALETG